MSSRIAVVPKPCCDRRVGYARLPVTDGPPVLTVMLARPAANWGAHPQPSGRVRSGSVATVLAAKDRTPERLPSNLENTPGIPRGRVP